MAFSLSPIRFERGSLFSSIPGLLGVISDASVFLVNQKSARFQIA